MDKGNIQDMKANLEILKTEGKISFFFHKLACPFMIFKSREEWIKILEELKEELYRK